MLKILFVCTGNTCRSPMAEALCQFALEERGLSDKACCISRGLQAMPGDRINPKAQKALEEIGVDAGAHKAQQLLPETLERADWVYVMTESQKELLTRAFPEAEKKIQALGVADPFGGSLEDYRACRDQLRQAVGEIVRKVQ